MSLWRLAALSAVTVIVGVAACRDFGRFEPQADAQLVGGGSSAGGVGGQSSDGGSGIGGAGGSVGGGGAGGGVPDCGLIDALADTFEAATVDRSRWLASVTSGGSVNTSNGALTLSVASTDATAELASAFTYDARNRSLTLEVAEIVLSSGGYFFWDTGWSSDNYVEFAYVDGQLQVGYETPSDDFITLGTLAYDAAAHRFWRVREDSGILSLEVAGDALVFSSLAQIETSAVGDWAYVATQIGAGEGMDIAESRVRIAGFNTEASSPNCAVSTFSDDFEDGTGDPEWRWRSNDANCTVGEDGGQLQFRATPVSQKESCTYGTSRAFDLTGGSVTIELSSYDPGTGFVFQLTSADGTNAFEWIIDQDEVTGGLRTGGLATVSFNNAYSAEDMRYLRLREEGGMLHWEASQDGSAFDSFGTASAPFDVTTLRILMGVYTPDTNAQDLLVTVDNLNITP